MPKTSNFFVAATVERQAVTFCQRLIRNAGPTPRSSSEILENSHYVAFKVNGATDVKDR